MKKKQTQEFRKIVGHPDKNLIVRMLGRGDGVRAVAKAIKELHPDDKKLHISIPTLQKFRKEKLNIEGDVLEAIKKAEKEKIETREDKKLETQLRRIPAYREKIDEAAGMQIDIRQELRELLTLVKSRVEDLFDRSAEGTLSVNEEGNLHKYFASWTTTIQQWAKYVDKIADLTVETNINITVIEDQMGALREAVRETVEEMHPELAIKFMNRLNQKISLLSYKPPKDASFSTIQKDTKILTASIEGENDGYGD